MKRVVDICKLGGCLVVTAILMMPGFPSPALAVTPPPPTTVTVQQTPPPSSAPNLILTSIVGSSVLDYAELYNQGDAPLHLSGWSVQFTVHDAAVGGCADASSVVVLPNAWLLSKKYLTLERTNAPTPGSLTVPFSLNTTTFLAGCVTPKLTTLAITDNTNVVVQTVAINAVEWSSTATTAAQHKQRGNSPSSTRAISGIFDTDYKIVTGPIALNSDPLYAPPADASGLQILELLPNARSCSPTEIDPTCNDYVKLFNPTDQPINLASYRLRIGYKGQAESVTNTLTWGQNIDPATTELVLPAQEYFMLSMRNDGQPLSITDTGNYMWLEDAYGTTMYDPIVQYPDASSITKVGWAWAYDGSAWQWSSAPQPGAPNYFPPIVVAPPADAATAATVTSILKPCADDQYRNPETNRCKSIVTTAVALTSCDPGQERNPETNRCRSIATASSVLTPCQPGSERNPDTNRCRKITAVAGAATTAVRDIAAPSVNNTGWFVAALAIALALGYGVYEWRQELRLGSRKLAHWALTRATFWQQK